MVRPVRGFVTNLAGFLAEIRARVKQRKTGGGAEELSTMKKLSESRAEDLSSLLGEEDCLVLDVRSCTPCEAAWFELTSTAGKVSLGVSLCTNRGVRVYALT